MAYVRLKDDVSRQSTLAPIKLQDSISWPLKSREEVTISSDAEDEVSLAKSIVLQQDDSKICLLPEVHHFANGTKGVPAHWKPLSLSPLILIAVIILSILIAAAIEVLAQQSKLEGGLALSASPQTMPVYARLSYL